MLTQPRQEWRCPNPSGVLWYLCGLSSLHFINQLPHPLAFPSTHSPRSPRGSRTCCNILHIQERGKICMFYNTLTKDVICFKVRGHI